MSMTMVTNTNMNMVIPAVGRKVGDNRQESLQKCALLLLCHINQSGSSIVETKFNQLLLLEILSEMKGNDKPLNVDLWAKLVKTKGFCEYLRNQKNFCDGLVLA